MTIGSSPQTFTQAVQKGSQGGLIPCEFKFEALDPIHTKQRTADLNMAHAVQIEAQPASVGNIFDLSVFPPEMIHLIQLIHKVLTSSIPHIQEPVPTNSSSLSP